MGIGRSRFALFAVLAVLAVAVGVGSGYVLSGASARPSGSASDALPASRAPVERRDSPAPSSVGIAPPSATPAPAATRPPASADVPTAGVTTHAAASATSAPPIAAPTGTPGAGGPAALAAPTSAAGFNPRHTVVPMGFPLPATARYRYGPAWRTPRLGIVYPYNQIRGVTSGGTLLRAHDGVDLQVAIGTPVLAPFAGTIVNPAAIWKPWDPERYGTVVVVRSGEPTSRGYYAILVHLSSKSVSVGQRVSRGQVMGRTGISGNASGTIPHLHFELRAPFQITFHYAGVERRLDGFDPLPSLQAADPRRR